MIQAIIFDWGGVFTSRAELREFSVQYARRKGINFEAFNAKMIELWNKARISDIDSKLFWSELGTMAGVTPGQFYKDLQDFSGFEPDVLDFVKRHLKGNYRLAIISNQIETWFEPQIQQHHLRDIFDVIVTSYASHSAKPDEQIFRDALSGLSVSPKECVYIDDMEKNIPPARKLGMRAILYKDLFQLKKELNTILGASFS